MILYDSSDWLGLAFVCAGTVWPSIKLKLVAVTAYAWVAYLVADFGRFNFGSEGKTILLASMSFLLIFRANQAYTRYWHGRTQVGAYFSTCREFLMLAMGYVRGGARSSGFLFHGGFGGTAQQDIPMDNFDERAQALRAELVRLIVATSVTLRMHTLIASEGYCFGAISRDTKWRLDWGRYRLRQLLTLEEFALVDDSLGLDEGDSGWRSGPKDVDPLVHFRTQFRGLLGADSGPPQDWPEEFAVAVNQYPRPLTVTVHLAREVVVLHMNPTNNTQPWGIKERFVTELIVVLTRVEHAYDHINQIITTPLPLPYANLCKVLLSIFLLSMPFFVDFELGWFANTMIPGIVSLALLGIDAIATELENPFGDDANDLDLLERIHQLECEAIELLRLTGDRECLASFCWRSIPEFIANASCRTVRYYLGLRDVVPERDPNEEEQELSVETFSELSRQFTSKVVGRASTAGRASVSAGGGGSRASRVGG